MKKFFKKILFPFRVSLFLYVAAAGLCFVVIDHTRADIKRFNYLREYADYITDFASGKNHFSLPNTKRALLYYEHLMKYYPNIPTINSSAGFCYYHLGRYDKALEFYMKAMSFYNKFFGFYYNSALICIQQGKFADAIPILQQALNVNPGPTLYYPSLGFPRDEPVNETRLQDEDVRVKYIARAYTQCFKWLLLCYEKSGDYENMRQTALAAISQKKEGSAIFYYYAGLADFHLGNEDQAVYFFEKCIKRDYSFQQAYDYLEHTLEKAGAPDAAAIIAARKKKLKQMGLLSKAHADLNTRAEPKLFFYPPQRITGPKGAGFLL